MHLLPQTTYTIHHLDIGNMTNTKAASLRTSTMGNNPITVKEMSYNSITVNFMTEIKEHWQIITTLLNISAGSI